MTLSRYRSLTLADIDNILSNRFGKGEIDSLSKLPKPALFKDMQKATDRIKRAINNRERVIVVGDYDVDGVVSVAILRLFFQKIGFFVDWFIPNRFEHGYGFSVNIFDRVKDYDLIITVDNGISSVEEAKLCKEMGIDLIITDHHLVPKNAPDAYAIVNQKQIECNFPYKDICGAQISWYLIASLNRALDSKVDIREYLPFVSIAVIADIMPLLDINRVMVKFGIKAMHIYKTPPIEALLEYMDKSYVDSEDIAFLIAPLLNSAGRVEDAKYALDFLMSSSLEEARLNLDRLIDFNLQRKYIEGQITKDVLDRVSVDSNIILAIGDNWHEGVIGIVASRVARVVKKPVIVLTKSKDGLYKGSGRSFTDCDIFHIVDSARDILERFGGHKSAIGLTLKGKNLDRLKVRMESAFIEAGYENTILDSGILGDLDFCYINKSLVDLISRYEPFGEGNRRPKFITKNVTISNIKFLGKSKEHQKFYLTSNSITFEALLFREYRDYKIGDIVDIIFSVRENNFNNRVTIQLILDEIEVSSFI